MSLCKGYGPTGAAYYNSEADFLERARDMPCELSTSGGNTLRIDLSGATDTELRDLYSNATGVVFTDLIQLTSV